MTIAGWYISLRHERRREAERREERIWDYQTALLADIRSTSSQFASIDLDRHLEEVTELIESASEDRPYTPFVPRAPGSLIWPSISQEVHILPTEVIDPVVLFFSQLETIRNFVDDLRSDQFARLEQAREDCNVPGLYPHVEVSLLAGHRSAAGASERAWTIPA